jgi:fido (protein-threonine AMPylation protein)
MGNKLVDLIKEYKRLGIDQQLDYDKFYLYSIITHSTAIEGSTITELENQIMFDEGLSLKGKTLIEQHMNLDLKAAYEQCMQFARQHQDVTVEKLKELSALTLKNTGTTYHTMEPSRLQEFCESLNAQRHQAQDMPIEQIYQMSFDAHYHLVTIHPWADGNGRMARLLMNWLQFEFGLIPARIMNDEKEEYIKALVATREEDDLSIFRDFMFGTMERQIEGEIKAYKKNFGDEM